MTSSKDDRYYDSTRDHKRKESYEIDRDRDREKDRDRDRERYRSRSRSGSRERRRNRSRSRSNDRKYRKDSRDTRDSHSKKSSKRKLEYSDSSDSDSDRKLKKEKKKEKKKLKREARENKDEQEEKPYDNGKIGGYSNDSNPFGDSNLTSKFVWKAKREKLIKSGMNAKEYEEKYVKNKNKDQIQDEIEKAKKRREDRDFEQEQWEIEKDRLSRMKDMENNEELEKKEEQFHYEQACNRSETRLQNNRPKPIDFLYRVLHMDTELNYEHIEPVNLIKSLSKQQLEEIGNEVSEFIYLDSKNLEYWEACRSFVEHELDLKTKSNTTTTTTTTSSNVISEIENDKSNVPSSVLNDIKKLLQGKNYNELYKLESDINLKLQSGKAMNVEYWETLLEQLKIYKSSCLIRETFLNNLKSKISNMENAQQLIKSILDTTDIQKFNEKPPINISNNNNNNNNNNINIDKNDDMKLKEKDKGDLEDNEEKFDLEVTLETKHYSWHDKYRPRKPYYFNKVHSGYDWNKYNKTHYDFDNPPPKIVKGYKFNIFYPDLIDVTKAPTYFVESSGDPDTQIVRFHAGPPYEDIAFKIVNREWERSIRYGYKCVFERGVLYLWFNFKRYKYKR